jgi:ribonuclease HII
MVVAAYWTDEEDGLHRMGVRDSKVLSPARREQLASMLASRGAYSVLVVPARSIDSAREHMTLNDLEVKCFSSAGASLLSGRQVMSSAMPDGITVSMRGKAQGDPIVKVDAADVVERRFGEEIRRGILELVGEMDLEVLSMHKADRDHPSVGAASILAKVERDRLIRTISEGLGSDIGSGYPSDPVTMRFLKGWVDRTGSLPPHCRHSWETARRLMSGSIQSTLEGY